MDGWMDKEGSLPERFFKKPTQKTQVRKGSYPGEGSIFLDGPG
jgi:hypothetical protein